MLLETKIIFFSSEIGYLAPVIEGFITLIYPLNYAYNHITILPKENFGILQSPSPFIVGINLKYYDSFAEENELDLNNPQIPLVFLVVDIDSKVINLCSTVLNKEKNTDLKKKYLTEEFPELPNHYQTKLSKRLNDYIKVVKSNSKKEEREVFIKQIRYFFFQFMVSIFIDYEKYLNHDFYTNNNIGAPSIENLFSIEEFLKSFSYYDRPFYQKFIGDAQMFSDFIYKSLVPKDAEEILEVLFFKEHILEKHSRKLFAKKVRKRSLITI